MRFQPDRPPLPPLHHSCVPVPESSVKLFGTSIHRISQTCFLSAPGGLIFWGYTVKKNMLLCSFRGVYQSSCFRPSTPTSADCYEAISVAWAVWDSPPLQVFMRVCVGGDQLSVHLQTGWCNSLF